MIYLDYAATTPITPEARDALIWAIDNCRGNPSSRHFAGDQARVLLERARSTIAASVARPIKDVIFAASATEALNLAIRGIVDRFPEPRPHIVVSATEHKAVLETVKALAAFQRASYSLVSPKSSGEVDPVALARAVRPDTALVIAMSVNNETGVVNDINAIRREIGEDMLLLSDAAQALGRVSIEGACASADAVVLSSHKAGGPAGTAALVASKRFRRALVPQCTGGGQEDALRAGTAAVPLIHAMSVAFEQSQQEQNKLAETLAPLRNGFEDLLLAGIPGLEVIGGSACRAPHITNLLLPDIDGEVVVSRLREEVAISSGAACNGFGASASHVLAAMGLTGSDAARSIRISFGRNTTADEVRTASRLLLAACSN